MPHEQQQPRDFLSSGDVTRRLHVTYQCLDRWRRSGRLPAISREVAGTRAHLYRAADVAALGEQLRAAEQAPRALTTAETARYLGRTKARVLQLARAGKLVPIAALSRGLAFDADDVAHVQSSLRRFRRDQQRSTAQRSTAQPEVSQ